MKLHEGCGLCQKLMSGLGVYQGSGALGASFCGIILAAAWGDLEMSWCSLEL